MSTLDWSAVEQLTDSCYHIQKEGCPLLRHTVASKLGTEGKLKVDCSLAKLPFSSLPPQYNFRAVATTNPSCVRECSTAV